MILRDFWLKDFYIPRLFRTVPTPFDQRTHKPTIEKDADFLPDFIVVRHSFTWDAILTPITLLFSSEKKPKPDTVPLSVKPLKTL